MREPVGLRVKEEKTKTNGSHNYFLGSVLSKSGICVQKNIALCDYFMALKHDN